MENNVIAVHLERIDGKLEALDTKVEAVLVQATATNQRVTKLERWQSDYLAVEAERKRAQESQQGSLRWWMGAAIAASGVLAAAVSQVMEAI